MSSMFRNLLWLMLRQCSTGRSPVTNAIFKKYICTHTVKTFMNGIPLLKLTNVFYDGDVVVTDVKGIEYFKVLQIFQILN